MDTQQYLAAVQQKKRLKEQSEQNYLQLSKDRLLKIVSKKLTTVGVGSLKAIETKFGFLWGLDEYGNDSGRKLSPEEQELKQLFDELRNDIFDNFNKEIRAVEQEFEQYQMEWKRYQLTLPVKPEGLSGGNHE